MADSDHLEKMGRELKCPICLSLLNSAVSLTCNHVFCNLCILKSMKSDSSCPVCKVPYRRREVRPAPHMDNLVNIYKSMEVASGTNIFITQTALSTKISDGQNLAKCKSNPATLETGRISTGKQKKQKKFKGKGSKELVKIDAKTSVPHLVKPSFPAKKRIQVPQYPLSDTPKHPEKCEVARLGETVEVEPKDTSTVPKEKLAFNEHGRGEPMFSPFFWLREDDDDDDDGDAEKSSEQQMEYDLVMGTPTPNALCFSDIKSTDNESPNKTTLAEEVCSESRVADVFDTEMFEWTQRACSPELCSTPMKNQVGSKDELDRIQEKVYEAASHIWSASTNEGELVSENEKSMNAKQRTNNTDVELHMSSSLNTISARDHNERNKSSKRGKQGSRRSQRKRVKLSIDEALEEVPTDLNQGRKCANNSNALNLGKGNIKRGKKTLNSTAMNKVQDDVPSKSVEAKIHIQGNENVIKELLASACEEPNHDETLNLKYKTSKSIEKINGHSVKNRSKRSKIQNFDIAEANVLKEVSLNENQENENMDIGIPLLTSPRADDSKTSDLGMKTSKRAKRIKTQVKRELRNQKRLKLTDCNGKDGLLDPVLDGSSETPRKEAQTSKELQENVEIKVTDKSKITEKILHVAKGRFLHKCEGVLTQIRCAFCQSSEDSEASGEMVHYLKGRPVDADYNRESNIIHSHRNCTEWAPNVYFEDGTAINIETELARSRRIKCCCCGMKGAALGCYEKSCHKSFHVPCAKLVPQCRWDTENFVILCPLHSSSKLPNEISGSQGKSRKRSIPKVGSHAQQVVKHEFSTTLSWKCSGSHNKWVLCCSAITIAEKEIVDEFARLAGVSVTKTWGSNVTHVIASVDENGACKRTFKFLMGILEGKWILKMDWIKACMKAMEPVGEEPYEISVDIHGIRDGPRLGRLRVLNKQPKLFNEFKFYFTGEFMSSYKGYLQDLVVAAGGTVLQRKPILCDQGRRLAGSSKEKTFIVYSLELPNKGDSGQKIAIHNRRQTDAEALAKSTGAQAVGHSWILDSIAACKLQKLV